MANTVDKVISVAEKEVGYLEKSKSAVQKNPKILDDKIKGAGSDNYTKYWKKMAPALQGSYWCNCFVNWCFTTAYGETAARKLLCSLKGWSYYTPTSASYFKNNNQWSKTPKKGDIIYFKNSERIHHVGIVYKVGTLYVYTIEGNTSAGSGVVANGGGVAKKKYLKLSKTIAGYGHPKYDTAPKKKTESKPTTTTPAKKTTEYKVKVNVKSLRIRSGAGVTNKQVGSIKDKGTYTIVDTKKGWGKLKDGRGWVCLKYTTKL